MLTKFVNWKSDLIEQFKWGGGDAGIVKYGGSESRSPSDSKRSGCRAVLATSLAYDLVACIRYCSGFGMYGPIEPRRLQARMRSNLRTPTARAQAFVTAVVVHVAKG